MADYLGEKIKFNIEDNDLQKIRFNKAYGESQQATRSGKNFLENTGVSNTSNGVTFTINDDKTILVDGNNDGTANSRFIINNYSLKAGTYILNGCPSGGSSTTYRLAIQKTSDLSILGLDTGSGSEQFTIDEATNVQVAIFIQKGQTVSNLIFKPMIRLSSIIDDTYEQYGVMPSPDYRSEIENLEGENICPSLNTTRTINGVTFTKNKDGSITMNGTATAETTYPINVNTTTNTRTVLLKANSKYRMLSSYESGKYTTQVFYLKNNATTYTSSLIETVEETKAGMYIRVYKDAVLDNVTIYPQITKGEEYKPYVPHNSLEFKDVGSNVLELSKGTVTLNGVTLTSDGETITINGTVSANYPAVKLTNGLKAATLLATLVNNYISERVAQLEDIKDCTIQSIISGGSSTFTPYIGSYNKTVRELWYGIGTPAKTIQTSSTSLIAIYLGGKGSTYNNYKIKIGINKGTVAKPYEPYKQQTEYFPLSEGQKLYKNSYLADNGIHHKRKQVVFDGSDDENWTANGENQGYGIVIDNVGGNAVDKVTSSVLCDKLTAVPQSIIYEGSAINGVASLGGTRHKLYVRFDSSITTVALLREKLAESPILIEYELAEEEIVPYTETQQEAREKLRHFKGLNGENNITAQGTMTSTLDLTLYNVAEEDFDIYISKKGYFGALKYDINNLIDFMESNIPSIAEATESSVKIAGRDGDISLNTVYEPLSFEIVCYTEDNLTPEEKIIEEQKITSLLNSIKNQTKTFFMEREKKFYKVKYSGNLSVVRYPKHLKFTIPLKSSESYAMNFEESEIIGNGTKVSNTIKDTGAIFTIKGPATKPIISLNNYQMKYNENILEGNSLIINSEDSTITHITSAGVKTNAMRAYNHEFPKIKNGENQLAVSSGIDDENQVNVKWYDLKI